VKLALLQVFTSPDHQITRSPASPSANLFKGSQQPFLGRGAVFAQLKLAEKTWCAFAQGFGGARTLLV
jgi:hypothetical protein